RSRFPDRHSSEVGKGAFTYSKRTVANAHAIPAIRVRQIGFALPLPHRMEGTRAELPRTETNHLVTKVDVEASVECCRDPPDPTFHEQGRDISADLGYMQLSLHH